MGNKSDIRELRTENDRLQRRIAELENRVFVGLDDVKDTRFNNMTAAEAYEAMGEHVDMREMFALTGDIRVSSKHVSLVMDSEERGRVQCVLSHARLYNHGDDPRARMIIHALQNARKQTHERADRLNRQQVIIDTLVARVDELEASKTNLHADVLTDGIFHVYKVLFSGTEEECKKFSEAKARSEHDVAATASGRIHEGDAVYYTPAPQPVPRVWSDRLAIEILANQITKDYAVLDMASFRVLFQGDSFDECRAFKKGYETGAGGAVYYTPESKGKTTLAIKTHEEKVYVYRAALVDNVIQPIDPKRLRCVRLFWAYSRGEAMAFIKGYEAYEAGQSCAIN